jgi:hypothetical protein
MMAVVPAPAYDEVYEFLLSAPTPQQVIEFRPSRQLQERIRELLEANDEGLLASDQRAELDEFLQVEHFVRMLKIKARQKLENT